MTQQSLSPAAWAGLFLLALIWGGSFLSIRVTLDEVPVLTTVTFRVGGAALALWLWIALRGIRPTGIVKALPGLVGMSLLNNIIPFTLIAWGQQHIPTGLASILNAGTAIFGVVIAALVFADEKMTARKALGVGIGFLGVATALGLSNLGSLDPSSLGMWAVVGAAFSYGLSGTWARLMLKGVPPLVSAAGMLTVSALVMVPVALTRDGFPPLDYSLRTWSGILYLSVVASGIAYLLFYRVLALAGAGNLSLVTLLVAPVAIVLGAVVLGEELHLQAYLGFALLALGLLILDGRLFGRLRGRVA